MSSLLELEEDFISILHDKDSDMEQVGNYRRIALGYSVVEGIYKSLGKRRLGRFAQDRILRGSAGSCEMFWLVVDVKMCVCV